MQQKLKFNLQLHDGPLQLHMIESEKSGQKVKAKISKMSLSHINSMAMTEISPQRQSKVLTPNRHSSPALSQQPAETSDPVIVEAAKCPLLQENQEMLRSFGIPENFASHFQITDEYCHNICRDRISAFEGRQNLQLDPRDERIRLPLNSRYLESYLAGQSKGDMEPLLDEVRDWLIDLIEITCSISFNHIKRCTLAEKETKNWAAKNILFNVKDMFEGLNALPVTQRFQIMKFVNSEAQHIIEGVILKYPQSSSKGASRRVKKRVPLIDNREDDQYDFLHRHGITIPYRKSGDYSQEVMAVLNRLIAVASDPFHPDSEETNFEVFTEIMEYIFENSGSQPASSTVADIAQLVAIKTRPKGENYLLNSTNITQLREALSFSERVEKKSSSNRDLSSRDYLIGHKVPAGTAPFSEKELEGGTFRVNDSSVLRIITKWAEELREKVENAEEVISKRAHKFKLKSGKFMNLESTLKERLYFAAQEEEVKLRGYLDFLNKENTALQIAFAEEENIGRNAKHDTKVGIFAAKINQIASQYMFKYMNRLIHSLLLIPRAAASDLTNETEKNLLSSVNLVTLKIGDLMRSKYCCSEQEFLKVLAVLEEMESKHPEILRIVRIKNRLEKKDSDVLINLYFMDKVECELQLSIKGLYSQTEQDSSGFNHFLYEVIRSKLGPISELANIVTQYDPLIHHFKRMNQFGPELLTRQWLKGKKRQVLDRLIERLKFKRDMGVSRSLEMPFICCKCFHLAIVTNPNFYYKAAGDLKLSCNKCKFDDMIDNCGDEAFSYLMQHSFKDEEMRSFFMSHLEHWDYDKEIKEMEEDSDESSCKVLNIPPQGYYLKKISKLPKMALYSAVFDPVSNCYLLMAGDEKGGKKPIAKIPLYLEKKKRIEAFKRELDHFYFFYFKKTKNRIDNGILFLSCAGENCCGKEIRAGPLLTSNQITDFSHSRTIQYSFCGQKTLLNLNSIPRALQRVEETLNAIDDPMKSEKKTKSIYNIKAMGCGLQSIEIISRFSNLTDLNISDNRELRWLKGLEECHQLKNLECKNCDLQNIDDLVGLIKLEYLNLKDNRQLRSIKALKGHTELVELNIAHTDVDSLEPLESCLKLQSLNIEGCRQISSLAFVNSYKLSYLNMVDCTGLELFDLQLHSSKSLRSVEYVKSGKERMGLDLIIASLNYLDDDEEEADIRTTPAFNVEKINQVLKFNSRKINNSFLIRTIP